MQTPGPGSSSALPGGQGCLGAPPGTRMTVTSSEAGQFLFNAICRHAWMALQCGAVGTLGPALCIGATAPPPCCMAVGPAWKRRRLAMPPYYGEKCDCGRVDGMFHCKAGGSASASLCAHTKECMQLFEAAASLVDAPHPGPPTSCRMRRRGSVCRHSKLVCSKVGSRITTASRLKQL